ncbi:TetR/AcrR family transcriptional regulator [Pseudomonas sp. BGr12]|uniref:TetR/AcrR family transcriptional regulator n=1 Tax=Pseudomonas sp. BGr12 TaxID=2936269 RepID=UPI0025599F62|nr:TetR/AcrR family transcriptional regulator [Pseudomonas sp. BJa5]MDL2428405.1 TetR/AcrR family transcriptional regulator [Pseudomonas sp. BJa5]
MGRRKTIDRDEILRVAEEIVSSSGVNKLTIDAVARAAGVSVGGVQYTFRSKESLIEAMLQRWTESYARVMEEVVGPTPTPIDAIKAHIEVTASSDPGLQTRAASMLASLLNSPDHLGATRGWYRERLLGLDVDSARGRRARVAFMAAEGAFFLRYFGFLAISESEWADLFEDCISMMDDADRASS